MTATLQTKPTYPKVRRMRFPFGQPDPMKRHFAGGDIVFSHVLAAFSFGFPAGEEFFIRSVRRFSDEITDPELKKRVAGFIGQESVHGQQHRELNEKLVEMGYRNDGELVGSVIEGVEEALDKYYANDPAKQRRFRLACLAATIAAEHFTAVQAERLLTIPKIQTLMTDQWVRNLVVWHGFEELEHKSVAFDVFRAVGGPEELRISVMRRALRTTFLLLVVQAWLSILKTDSYGRRRPFRVLWETVRLFNGPYLGNMRKATKPYLREGFHPDQRDTTAVLDEWRAKLFGEEGVIAEYLH